jgi:CRP-like cAMP-binding protein
MYERFLSHLQERIVITSEELDTIKKYLTPKKLRKKQYLLQEGDVAKYIAFVEKGLLRSFSVDEKGNEHIIQFALEGWTISDLNSFLNGTPAIYNVEALEDCELTMISRSSHDVILQQVPAYDGYMRMQLTGAYISMQKRLTSILSLSIEERYLNFTQLFPDLMQRVPQHMIASFMGLTPETLSRIRGKLKSK